MLNCQTKQAFILVIKTTLIGAFLGLILTEFDPSSQLKSENSFYLTSQPYNSLLGAVLGCTLGIVKANIKEYNS